MDPTESFVLPDEVIVFPVAELDPTMRSSIGADDGDYGLTKNNSRRTTRLIDAGAAGLLEEFRTPTSVPDAIVRFSRKSDSDPGEMLTSSFEFLSKLVRDGFLVTASSASTSRLGPIETAGDWRVLEPLRVLEDTEVHLVVSPEGERGVLKRVAHDADRWILRALRNEAQILGSADGLDVPALLEDGSMLESPYLVVGWRRGLPSPIAATQLRRPWLPDSRERVAAICTRILGAYADLHDHGLVHGDVHPNNVLVDLETDAVSLIDFGLAVDRRHHSHPSLRGGVEAFYSPEIARALLDDEPLPPPSEASEQYAVAVLVFKLLTGQDYLEQKLDTTAWREAVCTRRPRPFARLGLPPWPELERVLAHALAKEADDRHPTMARFRDAFAAAAAETGTRRRDSRTWKPPGLLDNVIARLTEVDEIGAMPLPRPSANLNYGAAGIAYFLYRASGILSSPGLFAAADVWIERAKREAARSAEDAFYDDPRGLTVDTVGRSALYHSPVGVHCVDALIACSADQPRRLTEAIDALLASAAVDEPRVDLTTGTAGQLIACATVLEAMTALGWDEERERLLALGHARSAELVGLWASVERSLPGTSEPFYGIAHGWAGVAYAVLRFGSAIGERVPLGVAEMLEALAEAAEAEGDAAFWPMGPLNGEVWTGWCHGSAGYALLWAQAHHHVGTDRFAELAVRAGEHVWSSPAPSTGHLCCGAAGQAYALASCHRLTGDGKHVDRARRRLEHGVGFVGTRGMSPLSLYKGDLGLALLEAELAEPAMAAMPMFEPERWP